MEYISEGFQSVFSDWNGCIHRVESHILCIGASRTEYDHRYGMFFGTCGARRGVSIFVSRKLRPSPRRIRIVVFDLGRIFCDVRGEHVVAERTMRDVHERRRRLRARRRVRCRRVVQKTNNRTEPKTRVRVDPEHGYRARRKDGEPDVPKWTVTRKSAHECITKS